MTEKFTNRLAKETSPYLLQHRHNPVDWYPWGEEAFAAARAQNKPIFLSVGYSTCYWCHVMERQCFENEAVAKVMNDGFINIKVDREERPDVDQLYMTALQVLTRTGGWPMSMWLLPDKRPFLGGTYFPPTDMGNRPGLTNIMTALTEAFHDKRADIEKTAGQLDGVLKEMAEPSTPDEPLTLSKEWLEAMMLRCVRDQDPKFGGFGGAPKFPRETLLELLLHWIPYAPDIAEIGKPLRQALDAMAVGGIRDHLGGGFHRYSTDAKWLVPHFEIMLYDNAMLGWVYAEASRTFKEPKYAGVARQIFDFVLRDMTSPQGAFYTAWDAEVDAHEGQNYLWTIEQIEAVLSPREASQFAVVYGLDQGANFGDPHHGDGTADRNVLFLAQPAREADEDIVAMRAKLLAHRQTRKKPLLDTKIITSWNALMIRALAHGGLILKDDRYKAAAAKAADFLWEKHRKPDGGLWRTSRDGDARHAGLLDDYAFLADALLTLGRTEAATQIVAVMRERFEDRLRGGFFFSDDTADDLLVRQKVGSDSPLPSGNAVAAQVCDALGDTATAARALAVFAIQANHHGESMNSTMTAILQFVIRNGPLRVKPGVAQPVTIEAPAEMAENAVTVVTNWTSPTTIGFELRIAAGYHLNADAIDVTSADVALGGVEWPLPKTKRYVYAEDEVLVYENSALLTIKLHQPLGEDDTLPLTLSYIPCTDSACLTAVRKDVVITK